MTARVHLIISFVLAASLSSACAEDSVADGTSEIFTNVSQLRPLFSQGTPHECSVHLTGTVTFVDPNRNLVVMQDETGAIALNVPSPAVKVKPGDLVSVESEYASPYTAGFPEYPYRPSGWDIRPDFEAPLNWGIYNLTRMRGYCIRRPRVNTRFWIASDNSSELWLSQDEDPSKVRRIAYIRGGEWANSREWSRYPSQRSEPILLQQGQAYYIEAFQEQLTKDENLSVAWEAEQVKQSVIAGRYLSPYISAPALARYANTKGILREYWTNFTGGTLSGLTGSRPFESILTMSSPRLSVVGRGKWPAAQSIGLDGRVDTEDNFKWVTGEGTVAFVGMDGDRALLELTENQARVQVSIPADQQHWPHPVQNWRVRVRGACESVRNANGERVPGVIWAPLADDINFIEPPDTNWTRLPRLSPARFAASSGYTNQAWSGFLSVRGVVTFNNRVLGGDCLYIQEDNAGIFVSQAELALRSRLQVGQYVEVGGVIEPGRYASSLHPILAFVLGRRPMPEPSLEPIETPVHPSRDGQWTEFQGVVQSVSASGVLEMRSGRDNVGAWVGDAPLANPAAYIDCTLRVRGVLALGMLDRPLLLAPSRSFVEIEERPPVDPFSIPLRPISALGSAAAGDLLVHRVKIAGKLIYRDGPLLFVEDVSGGCRVKLAGMVPAELGEWVEGVGFPSGAGGGAALSDALLRRISGQHPPIRVRKMDLSEVEKSDGSLVELEATVLGQSANKHFSELELQKEARIFKAFLAGSTGGHLPKLAAGTLVRITGVCDVQFAGPFGPARAGEIQNAAAAIQILLRSPSDVIPVRVPPWWNWKDAALFIGAVLTLMAGALLWSYLASRRLERRQEIQIAFSQQVLQGQENERHRIAANLHDSLGQSLLFIKNQAWMAMQPSGDESVRRRLDEISTAASQAIEEVRQIVRDLRPYQLDKLGLTKAIQAVIRSTSEISLIAFKEDLDNIDGLLPQNSEIHLYRIIQESLNNIVKHSGATEATVCIRHRPGAVHVIVHDNGQGYAEEDPGAESRKGGFGLHGIGERTRMLGGQWSVESQVGQGTGLTIVIPVMSTGNET